MREAKDRVRAAIQCAQFAFPDGRITVNLAPADLPKRGGRFDLPIALGILAASGQLPNDALRDVEFLGELGLTGELRAVDGVLPAAIAAAEAKRRLIVPHGERRGSGARRIGGCRRRAHPARSLRGAGRGEDLAARGSRGRALRARAGSARRARADARASRAGDRGRGPAPPPVRRHAGLRQDPARLAPAGSVARSERGRSARIRGGRFHQRPRGRRCALAPAPVSRAAPYEQRGRVDRRRARCAARRGVARAQRRAVPRRVARVGAAHAASAARAPRIGRRSSCRAPHRARSIRRASSSSPR